MGGFVDDGIGTVVKTSPYCAAIEKAQADLRQEYDLHEERRRELEFLEKGGDPLDFKYVNPVAVSVHSTLLTDPHQEQNVTSQVKGNFALAVSPLADLIESSGRPGLQMVYEPTSDDNLLLFDGNSKSVDREKNSVHTSKKNKSVMSEQSSHVDGSQNIKELEESAIFCPYAQRSGSKSNRDGTWSGFHTAHNRGGHVSSLTAHVGCRNLNVSTLETKNPEGQNLHVACRPESANSKADSESKQALESTVGLLHGALLEGILDNEVEDSKNGDNNKSLLADTCEIIHVAAECCNVQKREDVVLVGNVHIPSTVPMKVDSETSHDKPNGLADLKSNTNEGQGGIAALGTRGLDSESSCNHTGIVGDGNNDSDACSSVKNTYSGANTVSQTSKAEVRQKLADSERREQQNENQIDGSSDFHKIEHAPDTTYYTENAVTAHDDGEFLGRCDLQKEEKNLKHIIMEQNMQAVFETKEDVLDNKWNSSGENNCPDKPVGSTDLSVLKVLGSNLPGENEFAPPGILNFPRNDLKLENEAHENATLKEAQDIEEKRKRISQFSIRTLPSENCQMSHWDFVLEEMTWLANDFAQERLWKITNAAQLCHRIASMSLLRLQEQNHQGKGIKVAHDMANAIMQFWRSIAMLSDGDKVPVQELKLVSCSKNTKLAIQGYAMRFLRANSSHLPSLSAEVPRMLDGVSNWGILDISWEDNLAEENLFYSVPCGVMENYRKSIESYVTKCGKIGSVLEEVDTLILNAVADAENEGETSALYVLGAFEGSKSSKFPLSRRKKFKSLNEGPYEMGEDLPYMQHAVETQHSMLMKRSLNLDIGSIPTKRTRTSHRQRFLGPSNAGATVGIQAPAWATDRVQTQAKTYASSGDTNSLQDDQSTLNGGTLVQKSLEVKSAGNFGKDVPYDSADIIKSWKKIKANNARDQPKKRLKNNFDSSGLYAECNPKKPKVIMQPMDNSFEDAPLVTGSIPSPAASQMSDVSNAKRVTKFMSARDKGKQIEAFKISTIQRGTMIPWTLLEDQALVVFVHDMGPNWELVSDAINSTLQFKCIFRKPEECRDRHKFLMDKSGGDGADSAEDSGSFQSYPTTLPVIPKGSARQLFQRLQGPMMEERLKEHFGKIINIGKKQYLQGIQNNNVEQKQIPIHHSHSVAVSQVFPDNLNGVFLTPLDLLETTSSSPDVSYLGCQGSHSNSLALPNQAV